MAVVTTSIFAQKIGVVLPNMGECIALISAMSAAIVATSMRNALHWSVMIKQGVYLRFTRIRGFRDWICGQSITDTEAALF